MTDAYWSCSNCGQATKVNIDRRVARRGVIEGSNVFCMKCGFGSNLLRATLRKNADGHNWCSCIPLTGVSSMIPLGIAQGGWIDANGRGPYTREDFREKFCVDPEINWYYRHPERKPNGWKPYWCENPMEETQTPNPPTPDQESKDVEAKLQRLKEQKDKGEITLEEWRKKVKEVLENYIG